MEHLRQSILEAESKTGRRLTELRREFNKLAAGKLSEGNYKFLGSFNDEKNSRTMTEPPSTNRDIRGIERDHGYGYDVDTCREECNKDKKNEYFALQDGGQCWCSTDKEYEKLGDFRKKGKTSPAFCWKSQKALKRDDTRNFYGPRATEGGEPIGLTKGTRVEPGEGGSGWCNSVYSMKEKSGPTLTDVDNTKCYKAKRGAFGTTIKNITPEECAEMFPDAKEIAIHAVGDEFGRFECSTIKKKFGESDIHDSYPNQTHEPTEVEGIETEQFYNGRMCIDEKEGNQYNAPEDNRSDRVYRILKVNRAKPKKKSKKSKKKTQTRKRHATRSSALRTRRGTIRK